MSARAGTASTKDAASTLTQAVRQEDGRLKRGLGFWSLLAAGIGSVIGSGWLFSSMYAAQAAGPAALIPWLIAGGLMLLIALVFAELGIVRPESGGLVRYPLYSNGRLAATIIGLAMWLAYVANPPTEASGMVQYAGSWLPGVYDAKAGRLTTVGILLSIALMAVFVLLNYFGLKLFARSNNIVTAIKVLIPTTTIVLLIASGFDHTHGAGGFANFTSQGGFAPKGFPAALAAIAGAGMVFAYTGFRNIIELSGEARSPRRDIPRALVTTIVLTIGLYLALQTAFLVAIPQNMLAKSGWTGINFDSPFANLAQLLGISWLYWLLIADSSLSPAGSGIVYTGANARNVFGLAKNGFFPRWVMKVHEGSGIPRRALILNFVIGICFLLPLPSWHDIVGVVSTLAVFTFSIGSVTLIAFRNVGVSDRANQLRGMRVIAPLAFIVSSLVIYWAGWAQLVKTIPIIVAALIWYVILHIRGRLGMAEIRGGGWLVVYLAALYLLSFLGSYGGIDVIGAPWDTIAACVVGIACYIWGASEGTRYMREHPRIVERLTENADADAVDDAIDADS